ncbi:MAG TPA: hypothetical protein VKB46_10880, partial [Pyrinomonadaceae bacterium]|nr:hypothetical protein [Pyrinomonadaceae bacterium]
MAKHGKLQTLLEYSAARSVLALLGALPISTAMSLGRSMGKVAYWTAKDLRRTAQKNLQLAFPEKDLPERNDILRECFSSLGRELGVFSHFSTSSRETLLKWIEPQGLEHLRNAKTNGKGVILFTGHLGAWEFTALALSLLGYPL